MNRSPRTAKSAVAAHFLFAAGALMALLGAACRAGAVPSRHPLAFDGRIRLTIWGRLQTIEQPPLVCAGGDLLLSASLRSFYERRDFRPAWSRDGVFGPPASAFLAAVREADADGLNPQDYHFRAMVQLFGRVSAAGQEEEASPPRAHLFAEADLLLTDAFFLFASHLAKGKVDQDGRRARWNATGGEIDPAACLERVLSAGDVSDELARLRSQNEYYVRLKTAYAFYRRLEANGGWPAIPAGLGLRKGVYDRHVPLLRSRLRIEGPGPALLEGPADLFDEGLEAAVAAFQQRHSLPQTGAVDGPTLTALNIPAAERARQIALNLERWRWLPHDLGFRYVLVDVTDFELFVVEDAREIMRMKIVAGTATWPTPVFTSMMTDIVVNPSWLAPQSVLAKELINSIRADPNYLKGNKMHLFRGWGLDEMLIDPKTIDFKAVDPENLDFYLIQQPGPLNVLGRLKFSHPNRYDIYLHDTPYQSDFGQALRTFSHGCIRIGKPMDFAVYLLNDARKWPAERISALIEAEAEVMIPLHRQVAVHVFSGTAWALKDGTVHFRPDIYLADPVIERALSETPPKSRPVEIFCQEEKTADAGAIR